MTINSLKNLIQRCHQRHEKPLQQRKTVIMPALYKSLPYKCTVYCARRYPVLLADLEAAGVSFMPIGRAPGSDHGPRDFGGDRFSKRQRTRDWQIRRWNASWGIQVYTGIPSERDGARWHDFNFTYQALCAAPDAVYACIEALVNTVENPLLTLSKSGELRFSCRVQDYLHPNAEQARSYIYKHIPTTENSHHQDVYLEILGEESYSRWDARYEILLGNLLDPPVITKEVLFAPIDALRAALHEPGAFGEKRQQRTTTVPASLGSHQLDLAKEAFLRHGFSYVQEDNNLYRWSRHTDAGEKIEASLWERDGTVWVRASTPNAELPTKSMPITEVWDDTGILPAISSTSEKVLAIREGELSPLAIKRPHPVLQKPEHTLKVYEDSEENSTQIQRVFEGSTRIFGLINQASTGKTYTAEFYVLNGGSSCLNVPTTKLAEIAEKRHQNRNVSSIAHWKPRTHLWERVKEIPREVRMVNPFQHGNVCEDPERCESLVEKGGNPSESICPECPVYTACQQRGYLSQSATLQRAKVQISTVRQLFFNPNAAEIATAMLKQVDETERLCIIDETHAHQLFLGCALPKNVLEAWSMNWQESALGNFAKMLLNAVEIRDKSHADAVKRIRTAVQTFEWQEEEIISQMHQVNIQGTVVARGTIDTETGKELARFTIEFEGGASAYIPLDTHAADRIRAKGMSCFSLSSFVPNQNMKIAMPMAQAIELGILNTETVENIKGFPTVCPNPNWTYWHQLKYFFAHYTRDADAPMLWNDKIRMSWSDEILLQFWVPPVLHPSVKRLLLISPTLSEQELQRIFPDDTVEVIHSRSASWKASNQVFQIRTGVYPRSTILDRDNNWDVPGMAKMGQRFFLGIRAEVERDPSIKHAIITYRGAVTQLADIAAKENVCFVTDFKDTRRLETGFEEAQVIWVVGTGHWAPEVFLERAQTLFGNDEQPLSYKGERDKEETELFFYEDERVQNIYEQTIAGLLIQTVGHARLHHLANKKIVLVTSFPLPDITDRPETLLFDWEDFEVAGDLDKLPDAIATRQRYEVERDKLTADSSRDEVERVLGCSSRQANRILQKFRAGKPLRVPFREQILSLLANGEKKAAELAAAIDGNPKAIHNELRRLTDTGEIINVQWGVYALPEQT